MTTDYDPSRRFELLIRDEVLRPVAGRNLMARVYQPRGTGPFPALLDLHGGAWNTKDRLANAVMDAAIASSGVVVVAIDLRLAHEAPYPGAVQDANFGVRWLKRNAARLGADPATTGILGSSSGGHVAQLCAMRPGDPRYGAITLDDGGGVPAGGQDPVDPGAPLTVRCRAPAARRCALRPS